MAVTAPNANSGNPAVTNSQYIVVNPSGTGLIVNPGDGMIWSGQYAIATAMQAAGAKASAIGIALDRNPALDWAGRQLINSGLVVARYGVFHVSAGFSGQPNLGVIAAPSATGSGVNAASGQTGIGALWQTATPAAASGSTAVAPVMGIGQVIGWTNSGPAGTGQLDVAVWDRNADYY